MSIVDQKVVANIAESAFPPLLLLSLMLINQSLSDGWRERKKREQSDLIDLYSFSLSLTLVVWLSSSNTREQRRRRKFFFHHNDLSFSSFPNHALSLSVSLSPNRHWVKRESRVSLGCCSYSRTIWRRRKAKRRKD